jgi:Reverse transcriptase (RNA-dependent DNA polymerase)/Endonuclease-reverse transcriptase
MCTLFGSNVTVSSVYPLTVVIIIIIIIIIIYDTFKLRMQQYKADLILLTETWLHDDIPNTLIEIPGYGIFRSDRRDITKARGGGVCLYIRNSIAGHVVHVKKSADFMQDVLTVDSMLLEIKIATVKFNIVCVYRPDKIALVDNSNLIENKKNIFKSHTPSFLFGDLNYPEINWVNLTLTNHSADSSDFLDAYKELNAAQLITFPTRFRGDQSSLLDLLLTNDRKLVSRIKDEPPVGKSDHSIIIATLQLKLNTKPTKPVLKRNFRMADYEQINNFLANIEVHRHQNTTNLCEVYSVIEHKINASIEKFVPLQTTRSNPQKPWITHAVMREVSKKRTKWDKYRRTPTPENYAEYRTQNNKLKTIIINARKHYEENITTSSDKKFFQYIKRTLNSTIDKLSLKNTNTNEIVTNPLEIAELFALQFDGVFTLEQPGAQQQLSLPASTRCAASLSSIEFTPAKVEQAIRKLKHDSSPGPDNIPAYFLQKCADTLSPHLSLAMNESLEKGILHKTWSEAIIIPIYKKGDRYTAENYRPISLTCNPCKVMEKIIAVELTEFLLNNNIIPDTQHGFLPKRSAVTNLLCCLNEWTQMHDDGQPIDVIYLDFEKAFDKVPHNKLLFKLEHYGIRGDLLLWIGSFLKNRTYRVRANGVYSESHKVESGVPQGSVLGPLLFLVYISDLVTNIKTNISFFADDTKLYCNPLLAADDLKLDLIAIEDWTTNWQMSLNVRKCTVLHIGQNNPKYRYQLESNSLKSVNCQKDLGVYITADLKWETHIATIVKRANKCLFLVQKTFANHSTKMILKIYKSHIRPIIEYAHCVWNPYFVKDIELLERFQRKVTRIPPELKDFTYERRLQILQLTTHRVRRLRGDLIEIYKIVNSHYTAKINLLVPRSTNQLRGHSKKLEKEKCSKLARRNFLFNRVVYQWNGLREETVAARTIDAFKNLLDQDLPQLNTNFIHYPT